MDICTRGKCVRMVNGHCPEPVGYRIRSSGPIRGALWPRPGACELDVEHHCLAISLAAKSRTEPGAAIQVIHRESGQVVYQKPPEPLWDMPLAA